MMLKYSVIASENTFVCRGARKSNITRNPFKNEKVNSIYNIDIDGEQNSDKMTGGCCSDGKSLN